MSDEVVSSDLVPPACRFFREIIIDPGMTEHDISLVAGHTRECEDCKSVIARIINEKIASNKQAEASGA